MSPKLAPAALAAATPRSDKLIRCGFCTTGHHEYCPRATTNGSGKIWPCSCDDPTCGGGRILRCLKCKNERPGEVSPAMWECLDPEACENEQQRRLNRNPVVQQLKGIIDVPTISGKANKTTAKATPKGRAKPEPRDCACGCDGRTSGGQFLPGHDARLISRTVKQVGEARYSATAKKTALRTLKQAGASEKLVKKYEGALQVSETRAATKAAAPAPQATRPAAKKASAKKIVAEKVAPAEVEDDDDGF